MYTYGDYDTFDGIEWLKAKILNKYEVNLSVAIDPLKYQPGFFLDGKQHNPLDYIIMRRVATT